MQVCVSDYNNRSKAWVTQFTFCCKGMSREWGYFIRGEIEISDAGKPSYVVGCGPGEYPKKISHCPFCGTCIEVIEAHNDKECEIETVNDEEVKDGRD
jgi:hypothetical protein